LKSAKDLMENIVEFIILIQGYPTFKWVESSTITDNIFIFIQD